MKLVPLVSCFICNTWVLSLQYFNKTNFITSTTWSYSFRKTFAICDRNKRKIKLPNFPNKGLKWRWNSFVTEITSYFCDWDNCYLGNQLFHMEKPIFWWASTLVDIICFLFFLHITSAWYNLKNCRHDFLKNLKFL